MTNPFHQHLICYVLGVATFQLPGAPGIHKQKLQKCPHSCWDHPSELVTSLPQPQGPGTCGLIDVKQALGPALGRWRSPTHEMRLKGCRSSGLWPLGVSPIQGSSS